MILQFSPFTTSTVAPYYVLPNTHNPSIYGIGKCITLLRESPEERMPKTILGRNQSPKIDWIMTPSRR